MVTTWFVVFKNDSHECWHDFVPGQVLWKVGQWAPCPVSRPSGSRRNCRREPPRLVSCRRRPSSLLQCRPSWWPRFPSSRRCRPPLLQWSCRPCERRLWPRPRCWHLLRRCCKQGPCPTCPAHQWLLRTVEAIPGDSWSEVKYARSLSYLRVSSWTKVWQLWQLLSDVEICGASLHKITSNLWFVRRKPQTKDGSWKPCRHGGKLTSIASDRWSESVGICSPNSVEPGAWFVNVLEPKLSNMSLVTKQRPWNFRKNIETDVICPCFKDIEHFIYSQIDSVKLRSSMLQWHVAETCAVWPAEQGGRKPKMPKRVVIHRGEGWKQVYLSFADTWHRPFLFKWLVSPISGKRHDWLLLVSSLWHSVTHWMGPLFQSVSVNLVFVRMLTSYIFSAVVLSVSLRVRVSYCGGKLLVIMTCWHPPHWKALLCNSRRNAGNLVLR